MAEGASFAAIARDLGITRQAVHRRFRDLAVGETPLVTAPEVRRVLTAPEVRRVLQHAREEAAALGADELRSEHILLAVLRAGDLDAAAQLQMAGATLERARMHIEGTSPGSRMFRREPDVGDLRTLLEAPARHARARGGRRIEVEDLLLGALANESGGAARTLRALGVDAHAFRDRLEALLDAST